MNKKSAILFRTIMLVMMALMISVVPVSASMDMADTDISNPYSGENAVTDIGGVSYAESAGLPDDYSLTDENGLNELSSIADTLGLNDEERELFEALDPAEQVHISDGDLSISAELGDGWRNILLMGNDSRSLDENGRTDTMMIASINQQTGEIKLTSIMRDTMVNIPGKSSKNKINAAYRYGGANLAMKTVNEAFDMNISEYAVVNLANFAEIIDKIGGIEMDVSKQEMAHVNNILSYYIDDAKANGLSKDKDFSKLTDYGENVHLTGQQALAYSRIRKLDTDYKRTERQREVLTAIAEKLASQSTTQLMGTALRLWSNVKTNIPFFDAIQLGLKAAGSLSGDVQQLRLPADGTYKTGTYDGRWEMRADLDKNAALLHKFIYE